MTQISHSEPTTGELLFGCSKNAYQWGLKFMKMMGFQFWGVFLVCVVREKKSLILTQVGKKSMEKYVGTSGLRDIMSWAWGLGHRGQGTLPPS